MPSPSSPARANPAQGGTVRAGTPGIPPLVPVMAPIVAAALLLGLAFSRWFSNLNPSRMAPAVRFVDVTKESGIDFVHSHGTSFESESPTTLGSGVGVIDYNRDGLPDLFFANGATWPWDEDGVTPSATSALYRNEGGGRFSNVTAEANAGLAMQGMGVAVGDYDDDSWPDLFVTGVGQHHLLRNDGKGGFVDVTEQSGLAGDGNAWTTGAMWLDLDGDRDLDLIVCQYVRWPREIELEVAFKIAGVGRSYGAPAGFISASPLVFENLGKGTFVESAEKFGLRNLSPDTRLPRPGTLGVAPVDLNDDNAVDLAFFYHAGEPTLFVKEGARFREWFQPGQRQEGIGAGLAAMGALPVARNRDHPSLADSPRIVGATGGTAAIGSGQAVRLSGKLGLARIDYDLDGRLDLFAAGGIAEPDVNRFDAGRNFDGVPSLYWNEGEGWENIGLLGVSPIRGRGVAALDFDRDGDEDVVITRNSNGVLVLRNDQRQSGAWLRIHLVGRSRSRDGAGARVEVHTPRQTLTRLAAPAMGFLSQSENVLTFGLGEDARVRRIVIHWPGGKRQEIAAPEINRVVTVEEPE